MFVRLFTNCFIQALGAKGFDRDKLDSSAKGKVLNVSCCGEGFNFETAGFGWHSYMFQEGAIKIYEDA